jgi:hypothetical protein
MPVTQSHNVLGGQNQQPEYSRFWHPYAVDPAVAVVIAVGMLMQIETPYAPTVVGDGTQVPVLVEPSQGAATGLLAGVCVGTSSLGVASVVPNTIPGTQPAIIAMCQVSGVCQVLVDNAVTAGHTLNVSASSNGNAHDSGGTAITTTTASTIGVALQTVTGTTTAPVLCWVKLLGTAF